MRHRKGRVFDGGTLGLSLLPYLEDAETAILVDAIRADGQPGDFVRLDGEEVGAGGRDATVAASDRRR